jgi:hypothetical protein
MLLYRLYENIGEKRSLKSGYFRVGIEKNITARTVQKIFQPEIGK